MSGEQQCAYDPQSSTMVPLSEVRKRQAEAGRRAAERERKKETRERGGFGSYIDGYYDRDVRFDPASASFVPKKERELEFDPAHGGMVYVYDRPEERIDEYGLSERESRDFEKWFDDPAPAKSEEDMDRDLADTLEAEKLWNMFGTQSQKTRTERFDELFGQLRQATETINDYTDKHGNNVESQEALKYQAIRRDTLNRQIAEESEIFKETANIDIALLEKKLAELDPSSEAYKMAEYLKAQYEYNLADHSEWYERLAKGDITGLIGGVGAVAGLPRDLVLNTFAAASNLIDGREVKIELGMDANKYFNNIGSDWLNNLKSGDPLLGGITEAVFNVGADPLNWLTFGGMLKSINGAKALPGSPAYTKVLQSGKAPPITPYADDMGKIAAEDLLPNYKYARIPREKLTKYALDPTNTSGGADKARVFQAALGYNQSNADELLAQVLKKLPTSPAVKKGLTKFGQSYQVDLWIKGPNGKTAKVRTGWIVETGDNSRLTSIYVIKK